MEMIIYMSKLEEKEMLCSAKRKRTMEETFV
jgi:hypothetical protein